MDLGFCFTYCELNKRILGMILDNDDGSFEFFCCVLFFSLFDIFIVDSFTEIDSFCDLLFYLF